MRKYNLLFIAMCLFALNLGAQVKRATNEGGFYIKGGVNRANISITSGGSTDDANVLTSFNAGFVLDLVVADGLSIQPGLLLNGKGSKTEQGRTTDPSYYRATSNPLYVELPVNLLGRIPVGQNSNIFFGGGGYAAAGVSGKNKAEGKVFGVAFNRENEILYSDDDPTTSQEENAGYGKLKRFDYGLNGLGGIDFGRGFISVNYGHGLAKINSGTTNRDDDNNKHRVWSLSLGVKL